MSSNHKEENLRELDEANLTAYALGQLEGQELAEAEAMLLRSEKARQFVEETSRWAGQVRDACRNAPLPEPSASLRDILEAELRKTSQNQLRSSTMSTPVNRKRSLKSYLIGFTIVGGVAAVLVALLLPAVFSAREAAKRMPESEMAKSAEPNYVYTHPEASGGYAHPGTSGGLPAKDTYGTGKTVLYDVTKTAAKHDRFNDFDTKSEASARPTYYGGQQIELGRELSPSDTAKPEEKSPFSAQQPSQTAAIVQPVEVGLKPPSIQAQAPARIAGPGSAEVALSPPRELHKVELNASNQKQPSSEKQSSLALLDGRTPITYPDTEFWQKLGEDGKPISNSPNTEQYDPIHDNPFLPVAKQPLSTFSIDVDTASYANVRRFLREGHLPPPDAVRIEELINYFSYNYSPPTDGTPFSVNMETAQCPWKPEHRLLRIGLKGREIDRKNRGASNLIFLLDVSGSMNESNKLPLVKEAMKMLVGQLNEDDRVAIVTYASDTRVALPSARGNDRNQIISAIDALQAGGSTYGSGGIQLAYKQAVDHLVPGGVNRVILCTDGDLNVGVTRDEDLVEMIQEKAKSGVFLTVLGFGQGNLKDSKMQKLADKGNGIYAYIDGLREAHRVLVEQMTGSLVTIAKDVKIQIEFNPAAVRAYRLIGYEKRLLAKQDFNDDKKDAGEIGAGHSVTALYELLTVGSREDDAVDESGLKYRRVPQEKLAPQADSSELLTLKIRYKEPEQNASKLLEFTTKDSGTRFGEATPDFRFAASVASFGMMLRSSPYRGNLNYAAVAEFAAGAIEQDPNGYRSEFLDLVREASRLAGGLPR